MKNLKTMGVDRIITDYPNLFNELEIKIMVESSHLSGI